MKTIETLYKKPIYIDNTLRLFVFDRIFRGFLQETPILPVDLPVIISWYYVLHNFIIIVKFFARWFVVYLNALKIIRSHGSVLSPDLLANRV